jgi:antitoxin MazE
MRSCRWTLFAEYDEFSHQAKLHIAMFQIPPDGCINDSIMRVSKWGNSLAIRLPASVVEVLALKEGDEIGGHRYRWPSLEVSRKASRQQLLERLRAFRGRLPLDFKFDRIEANARSSAQRAMEA